MMVSPATPYCNGDNVNVVVAITAAIPNNSQIYVNLRTC